MHEYSIVSSLVGRVEDAVKGYRVNAVRWLSVRIGELSGVDAGLLRTAYDMCAPGTLLKGAELRITQVAARWGCPRCNRDLPRGERLACDACGAGARLIEGDEIVLERIELEVDDV